MHLTFQLEIDGLVEREACLFVSGCKWLQGEGLSLMKHYEAPITRTSTKKCVFFVAERTDK